MGAEDHGNRRAGDEIGNAEIVRMLAAMNTQIRDGFVNADKRFDEMSRRIELTVTKEVFDLSERDHERRMGQLELETVRLNNALEDARQKLATYQTESAERTNSNFRWIMASFVFPIAVAVVVYVIFHVR